MKQQDSIRASKSNVDHMTAPLSALKLINSTRRRVMLLQEQARFVPPHVCGCFFR